jgi:hypothetical protein
VPAGSAPWIDSWAPAQYVFGSAGAAGPLRSPDQQGPAMNSTAQTYDSQLHWKLAGTIIGALVLVYALQALGFRFVVAVGG